MFSVIFQDLCFISWWHFKNDQCMVSFQPCIDAMRLILVKPTNATRRLDSTGEVFHEGGHEHCTSGCPSPPIKTPEGKHDPYRGTSVETPLTPQEKSQCCVSSSPHETCNGLGPPRGSAQMSPLKTRNLTLSQLSDEDWLLLCGHVGNAGDESPSAERAGTSVGHPNHNDRCRCPGPDASSFQPQSKQDRVQDCLPRVTAKRSLLCSPHVQPFSPSSHISTTCQVLLQQTNQSELLNPATNRLKDHFMPQCTNQEGGKEQPCNHYKLKDSSQATNLFNIPLDSVECKQKLQKQPHPAAGADVNWRDLFGKEPLLVQQQRKQEFHCLIAGDQTSGDPSAIFKCHHLPHDSLTSQIKRSSTPVGNKSVTSFSISQYSSLEIQDLMDEKTRQRQSQVHVLIRLL